MSFTRTFGGLLVKSYLKFCSHQKKEIPFCWQSMCHGCHAHRIISDSKLLFLDEPESALDFSYRYRMLSILRSRISTGRCSAIVTLHDPYLALNFCDRLLLLSDGHIISTICPQIDTLSSMEEKLCHIYGDISIHHCINKSGQKQIVMLKENLFESTN